MGDYAAFTAFVFFGLFSPGPNVILLTTSGARFGFMRTVPHLLGVAVGVGITSGLTGLGIGALLHQFPLAALVLKLVSACWIIWMAWNLWCAHPLSRRDTGEKPFTFLQAVLFQWVNPKVWAVALSASAYLTELSPLQQALRLGLTFSSVNLGVCVFWSAAGTLLAVLLQNAVAWQFFLRTMAVALVAFSVLVFL